MTRHTLILDKASYSCEKCKEPGMILVFSRDGSTVQRIGQVCWEHYTKELMALPALYEHPLA